RSEVKWYPRSERVALGLGYIAFRRGDNQRAVELLAPLQNGTAARQVTQLLAILSRQQNDPAASEQFEQRLAALRIAGGWPDPFYSMINEYESPEMKARASVAWLVQIGAYRRAAEVCVEKLKDGPQSSLYVGAGVNFIRAGDFNRGLEMLLAAEQLESN